MKLQTRLLAVLCIIAGLVTSGCTGGDTHEKLADETVVQLDRIATSMGSVSDKASAEKAASDVKSAMDEIKKIGERLKQLGDPGPELRAKLDEKMRTKLLEVQSKVPWVAATMKAGPEVTKILMTAAKDLITTMEEAKRSMSGK